MAASAPSNRPTLLFVQYGDFREDYLRLHAGGAETYQAQRKAVSFIADLSRDWRVVMVNMVTPSVRDDEVAPGLRVIGLGPDGPSTRRGTWNRLLGALAPDRIVLRTPVRSVFGWATGHRCRTLAVLADSFGGAGLRGRFRAWRMGRAIDRPAIEIVGNHGRAASLALTALGIPRNRIIPWDWEPSRTPGEFAPKSGLAAPDRVTLLFAGALTISKGADDVVAAVAQLARSGIDASATLLGGGDTARLTELAEQLGIAARIDLAGLVPNGEVVPRMRAADLVVIPSRHDYPEGLPLTIYEALISRTPIVASDHPMFADALSDGENALIYPAGNVPALAAAVQRLAEDRALYTRISVNSAAAWQRLQLPVTFQALVEHWLADDRAWLAEQSLAGPHHIA